ncbi:helix-turn-helix domain-containing protein [uncultured Amnibacterium sp.]|uniref:helix-turn-helix domain-containing protein n=1 Tax=uncultured Amnibacterium sp. TaxID=1631851 RepID=UPI0035CB3013
MTVVDETVRADDIDEAEQLLHRVYPIARFQESARPFRFVQQLRGDERVAMARFEIASRTEVHVDFRRTLAVGQLLGGAYRAVSNDDRLDPAGPFLFRPGEGRSWSESLDLLVVNFDQDALETFAAAAGGLTAATLRFHPPAPMTSANRVLWTETVAYARRAFSEASHLHNDLLRHATVQMLCAAVLAVFPIEVVGSEDAPYADTALPSAVRRALAYIDEHLQEPIGPEEIAIAARMSVRGLQAAFRRHLDSSPTAVLRGARLAAARADLLAADFGSVSVATVARRWGFLHLGRFAAQYREAFGERPGDSLRR